MLVRPARGRIALSGALALSVCFALRASSAEIAPAARAEIERLLSFVEGSGCEFYRNGTWHKARAARSHLERKYRYLLERGLVRSAEDFIERAASSSSASGEPYRVRCGGRTRASAEWLAEELSRHRGR